jgi:hypothetical protein
MLESADSNMCACVGQIFVATWQGGLHYNITNDEEGTNSLCAAT